MARKVEFPGGHLACGGYFALLREDEWTALQWMRFRFSKPDSAPDRLLRELSVPPEHADELSEFVGKVHSRSDEPLFPLRFGRGAHLQRAVQALVSRAPRRRGGPPMLRDVAPVERVLSVLASFARRAREEHVPVLATSAMTLLRRAWDERWGEGSTPDGHIADADVIGALESEFPEVGAEPWGLALARCAALEEAAVELATQRPERLVPERLARRVPGFPDEVYRQAIGMALYWVR